MGGRGRGLGPSVVGGPRWTCGGEDLGEPVLERLREEAVGFVNHLQYLVRG